MDDATTHRPLLHRYRVGLECSNTDTHESCEGTLKAKTDRMRALRVWSASTWQAWRPAARSRRTRRGPVLRTVASSLPLAAAVRRSASLCRVEQLHPNQDQILGKGGGRFQTSLMFNMYNQIL